jgi:hypothetical protein
MYCIPTYYKGILFRSRLEAKWARFLDLLKLPWLYEPKDLAGYIPDFIISGQLLAEVKGCSRVEELYEHVAKIEKSGWCGPWVLLGEHYTLQHGQRIDVPANAEALWAEACNTARWVGAERKATEYSQQTPSFDASLFRNNVTQAAIVAPPLQRLTLPEIATYKVPSTPRAEPTPPKLPF